MNDFAHFEIKTLANGESRVVVNGNDVSERVHAMTLQAVRGQPPVLRLDHVAASGAIDGDGIVQVAGEAVVADPVETIRSFLDGLDGDELERQATEAMEQDPTLTVGAAFMAVLEKATSVS